MVKNSRELGAWMSQLGLHFTISTFWRSILFGEGLQLKWIEGILPAAYILHGVLSPAALTMTKQNTQITQQFKIKEKNIFVHKSKVSATNQTSQMMY